jgi:hypothetical protein
MKKKNLLFTMVAIFAFGLMTKAQLPSYVPINGLAAWYPFNGNANDESGNGNNGIVNGASLTTDRFGMPNMAYNFTGPLNYIEIAHNTIFNSSEITVSTWYYSSNYSDGSPSAQTVMVSKREPSGWGNSFETKIGVGSQNVVASSYTVAGNNSSVGYEDISLTINNWFHYVYVHDNNGAKLYINGSLVGETAIVGGLTNNSLPIRIGQRPNGWHPFNGKIDDIGIWTRALTQCEIQDLYSSEINSTFVSAGVDQTICTGDQVTLSATGSQNYSWNNGVVDGATFSPTNTLDYIVTADSAGCQSTDTLTIFVNQPTNSTLNETALDSYTLNGQTYTQGGTFTQIIPNVDGCDSTITLNLTMNYTGINEVDLDIITISPNPTNGIINVQVDENLIGTRFYIFDEVGRIVSIKSFNAKITTVDLSGFNQGVYFFKTDQNINKIIRIIKMQ